MKLKILKIDNGGDEMNEAVWLKAQEACNLNQFVLADTTFDEAGKSNLVRHTFWFPDKAVAKGDYVVVLTRSGTPKKGKTTTGKPLHYLFWNLDHAVWNNDGDRAVLIEISDSEAFTVSAEA